MMPPLHRMLVAAAVVLSLGTAAADGLAPNPGLRHHYPLPAAEPRSLRADVCIYGGTPAGVAAAVQARRMGKTAVLAVFRRHVGGMTSAGLTAVDLGRRESIGGLAAQFLDRVGQWSGFRPDRAEEVFREMLDEAGTPVLFEHRLTAVRREGGRITAATFENGTTIEARMFIDATYEGDLLAAAGVSHVVGREDNARHGETANGFQISLTHQFRFPIDPYRVARDPSSGLLPGITADPPRQPGTGDRFVQAYNFRMWLVEADRGLPFPRPAGYSRDDYALLERYLTTDPAADWDFTYRQGPIKLNVGDCNAAGPVSTDFVGGSNRWPEAGHAERERIFQAHVTWQQGMLWYLANDDAVPAKVRAFVRRFGLPRDLFPETGGWPHEIYVREGRRMVADRVMTEHDCVGRVVAADPVGLASYTMDSHHVQRVLVDGVPRCEGCIERKVPAPYPVSYRALVPKKSECENLLVPVCLSASHVAYGSIRMEPVFMILGQAAATAAAMAIDGGAAVQDIDYPTLRSRLEADRQILAWPIAPSK